MSTMRANTIANVAGTGSPDIVGGELSRARFWLNGTGTISALDSFGISSFTDNGAGDYSATFSTAFPNAFYIGSVAGDNLASGFIGFTRDSNAIRTVNALRFGLVSSAIASTDGYIQGSVFGDKP